MNSLGELLVLASDGLDRPLRVVKHQDLLPMVLDVVKVAYKMGHTAGVAEGRVASESAINHVRGLVAMVSKITGSYDIRAASTTLLACDAVERKLELLYNEITEEKLH